MEQHDSGATSVITSFVVGVAYCIVCFTKFELMMKLALLRSCTRDLSRRHVIVSSQEEWELIYPVFMKSVEPSSLVGLSCRYMVENGSNRPVALLILACESGLCILLRICVMRQIPQSLKELLRRTDVLKVGVEIQRDGQRMSRDHDTRIRGCLDLRFIALKLLPGLCKKEYTSLTELACDVMLNEEHVDDAGVDWEATAVDWEAASLSAEQVESAATVPTAAVSLYKRIHAIHSGNEMWSGDTEGWQKAHELGKSFVDMPYRIGVLQRERRKRPSERRSRVIAVHRSPFYSNCRLEAPDGQLLCTCDKKKAEWYINKGLGEIRSDDPYTVRLNFEPNGRPEGLPGLYYVLQKENRCVVCGNKEKCVRKNVVPREYRKYFPSVLKDHQSHDVLLLCWECHKRSNVYDSHFRDYLAHECDAPIDGVEGVKMRQNIDLRKIRLAARALTYNLLTLPAARVKELSQVLLDFYDESELTEELIEKAMNIDSRIPNEYYQPHGLKVVLHFQDNGGLVLLERAWRDFFLQSMCPKYLPSLWSVDHTRERLQLKALHGKISGHEYMVTMQGLTVPSPGQPSENQEVTPMDENEPPEGQGSCN